MSKAGKWIIAALLGAVGILVTWVAFLTRSKAVKNVAIAVAEAQHLPIVRDLQKDLVVMGAESSQATAELHKAKVQLENRLSSLRKVYTRQGLSTTDIIARFKKIERPV